MRLLVPSGSCCSKGTRFECSEPWCTLSSMSDGQQNFVYFKHVFLLSVPALNNVLRLETWPEQAPPSEHSGCRHALRVAGSAARLYADGGICNQQIREEW